MLDYKKPHSLTSDSEKNIIWYKLIGSFQNILEQILTHSLLKVLWLV